MPLDPTMTDAILGTFKNMVQECKDKNFTGEDMDKMCQYYDRMVQLTQETSDMNVFNGQVMQENLYMKFSDHYGRVLSSKAMADQEEKGYDDATLLKQTLDALKDAVERLKKGKQDALDLNKSYNSEEANDKGIDFAKRNESLFGRSISDKEARRMKEAIKKGDKEDLKAKPNRDDNSVEIDVLTNNKPIIDAIENLISFGEQDGMTLPRFLRVQIEKGMDKAMEGSILVRNALEYSLGWAHAMSISPFHIKKAEEKLQAYDILAEKAAFKTPNTDELNFSDEKIDYKYEPDIIMWEEIVDRWQQLIETLSEWSLSYCEVAPFIDPWKGAVNPKEATKETQAINPGIFKQRERLFLKYFGFTFMDLFKHPSFEWHVKYYLMDYSQEFIEFIIETVYPQCIPFQNLDSDSIDARQAFFKEKREGNPEYYKQLLRQMNYYDSKFGEGRYTSKFGVSEPPEQNAAPWNWEGFVSGLK